MNKRGAALILSYAVILVLTILASAFLSSIISENNLVRRYEASSQAFWAAEAGLANAYHTWSANRGYAGEANTPLGEGTYTVTKTPLNPQVTVTGTVGTTQRTIHAQFVGIPSAFNNVFSVGGNLNIMEYPDATLTFNGNTRYSGNFNTTEYGTTPEHPVTSPSFNPDPQPAPQSLTTITIPDYNGNGTDDEFDDFVQFGRQVIASYPPEQTIYIQTNSRVIINSLTNLAGKKVIFIEGSQTNPNTQSVFINGDPFPADTTGPQDLTIISTGAIMNGIYPWTAINTPSRLNTLSWGTYYEMGSYWTGPSDSPAPGGSSSGVHYSHTDIHGETVAGRITTFTGSYVCNGNADFGGVLYGYNWIPPSYEYSSGAGSNTIFTYSNRAAKGDLPPGFEFLGTSNGTPKLIKWSEE